MGMYCCPVASLLVAQHSHSPIQDHPKATNEQLVGSIFFVFLVLGWFSVCGGFEKRLVGFCFQMGSSTQD
jgi:hypothetical protein